MSAEIEKSSAAGDRALRNGYPVAHRRYVAAEAALREKLYELHRLVDNLRSRFPGLEPSTRTLRDDADRGSWTERGSDPASQPH